MPWPAEQRSGINHVQGGEEGGAVYETLTDGEDGEDDGDEAETRGQGGVWKRVCSG